MFARLLEMSVNPENKAELLHALKDKVLPILKHHVGFIDVMPLEVEIEPSKLYLISLWHEKRGAEEYEKEDFAKVKAIYQPFLAAPLIVRLCKVDETIFKKAITVAA